MPRTQSSMREERNENKPHPKPLTTNYFMREAIWTSDGTCGMGCVGADTGARTQSKEWINFKACYGWIFHTFFGSKPDEGPRRLLFGPERDAGGYL